MSFVSLPRIFRTATFGLASLFAALFAVCGLIIGTIVYWTVETSFDRQAATRIDAEIGHLQEEFELEGLDELIEEVRELEPHRLGLEYLVADATGKRLVGNLPPTSSLGWHDVTIPSDTPGRSSREFRIKTIVVGDSVRLSVGDDLAPFEDITTAFIKALGWALSALLLASLSCGLLLSRGFLKRVDAITQTAQSIIDGQLQSRVPLRGTNDNFDRLSMTLNVMLDRIQILMESLSQVSNDIAHALRTPLGRLRQKLEKARLTVDENSESEEIIDEAALESDQILETFSALLRIAQVEAAKRSAGFGEVNLSKLFESVAGAYEVVAEDQGKLVTATISRSIKTWGDKDLLMEMLANLLDNAIAHTPSGTHIEVLLRNGESCVVASVSDDGPGVPTTERDLIFRRFYRPEKSLETPGNGLGLAMVAAVAGLHDVELTVDDNCPGLRISMAFRRAEAGPVKTAGEHS